MAIPRSGNVFARSVLCDPDGAISKFMSFARLSGDCFGTPALVRLKPHGARENRLATKYRGFVRQPWNNHNENRAQNMEIERRVVEKQKDHKCLLLLGSFVFRLSFNQLLPFFTILHCPTQRRYLVPQAV